MVKNGEDSRGGILEATMSPIGQKGWATYVGVDGYGPTNWFGSHKWW